MPEIANAPKRTGRPRKIQAVEDLKKAEEKQKKPKKMSQAWFQDMLTRYTQKKNWTVYNRLDYQFQILLNYKRIYDVESNGPQRDWFLQWVHYVRMTCVTAMQTKEPGNFGTLYWELTKIEAQHRVVDAYFLYLERKRMEKNRFYQPRRQILVRLGVIQALQDLIDDKIDVLSFSFPPGTGKSTLEIFLLSGIMGWFPDMPNLASAFSGGMTKSIYDGVSQIIADDTEYAWKEIFPNVEFDPRSGTNSKEQTINVGKAKRFKSLTCCAIGASLTGRTRCEYLLCADDMVSGIEEAMSKPRMDKLWQAFNTDLLTRRKDGCKLLIIGTRWSVHDPIGKLYEIHKDNPRARFMAIPALNKDGESNFNYVGGVGFSTKYFKDIQEGMDDISFKCLFMAEPIEREGLLYHDDEIKRYLELPLQKPDAILSVVDTKNKGTDFFFQPVLYQYGEDYYLVDTICSDNSDYEVQYSRSANLLLQHNVEACKFESNNGGDRVALEVSNRVKDAKGYCNITQEYTTSNKETQIIVYAPWVKKHVYFKDRSLYHPRDDYGVMMSFLMSYVVAGKNDHDDVPDGLSALAKWRSRPEDVPVVVGRRPF